MPTHNEPNPGHEPEKHEVDASAGFEHSDANVTGIAVFMISLAIFVAVTGLLCYGIGGWFNARMNREDGPNNKWTKTVDVRQLGNMPSSPELQNKVAEITQTFPTPRLLTDDGDQDVADMHAREDLLLDHYSWIDQSKGSVRIPIDRAMELVAQRGLPAASAVQTQPLMTGETAPAVTAPLTDGFAPTGYEQEQAQEKAEHEAQGAGSKD
jgi:hypothetical protein